MDISAVIKADIKANFISGFFSSDALSKNEQKINLSHSLWRVFKGSLNCIGNTFCPEDINFTISGIILLFTDIFLSNFVLFWKLYIGSSLNIINSFLPSSPFCSFSESNKSKLNPLTIFKLFDTPLLFLSDSLFINFSDIERVTSSVIIGSSKSW